jgi:hypothetical protein
MHVCVECACARFGATCWLQVRLLLERNREELQRQLAASDTQLSIAQARLSDAESEVAGVAQRLALEQGRHVCC